jgi:carbon-monoxide dehydrogenase small subunit
MSKHTRYLIVNETAHTVSVDSRTLLSDTLREGLGLTGTKRGCETGTCGACSVLVNGELRKSCLTLTVQHDGHTITTVEGLARDGELSVLQQAFMDLGGLQCGYCTPGFLMAATALLAHNPKPTEAEVREALSGNLCRCTGYTQIVESVIHAAQLIHSKATNGT